MPLSVIIHTKNAASTLTRALKSVTFADEIVVIDMESSDETVALAKDFTDHIFTHADEGYADPARNYGLSKATHPWILVLDADEEVSEGLRGFILSVLSEEVSAEFKADVYAVPRQNYIFGQWLEHTGWWPDYQLRFFKKGQVQWERGVHRQPTVTGHSLQLPAAEQYAIKHLNYQNVEEYIDRLNRYTSLKSDEDVGQNLSPFSSQKVVSTLSDEFNRRFFAEQGYLDGVHGLSLAWLQAFYQLTEQLKNWQKQGFPPQADADEAVAALQVWQISMAYWIANYQVDHSKGMAKLWWKLRRKFKF